MKTALLKSKRHTHRTPHAQLCDERVALVDELATFDLDYRRGINGMKLSAEWFAREALQIAQSTPARLKGLAEKIDASGTSPGTDGARRSLVKLVGMCRSFHWASPTKDIGVIARYLTPTALAELASWQFSCHELQALAAEIAAKEHPGDFGKRNETWAEVERKVRELSDRCRELDQRIEKEWTPEDLEFSLDGGAPTFKISHGAVPVGPKIAERLIGYLLKEKEKEATS